MKSQRQPEGKVSVFNYTVQQRFLLHLHLFFQKSVASIRLFVAIHRTSPFRYDEMMRVFFMALISSIQEFYIPLTEFLIEQNSRSKLLNGAIFTECHSFG